MAGTARADVGVGVAAAANRVGVAAATLRAWEHRYGLIPSQRTAGGHRRYSNEDVATLTKVQRLIEAGMPTGSAATLIKSSITEGLAIHNRNRARAQPSRDGYARLAAAGDALDAPELARVARSVLAQRGVVGAWIDVFAPYLQSLGRQWSRTGHVIDCEHLAVAVLQSALRKVALRRLGLVSGPVLLAAVPGERHTLPLDALAAALAEAGVESRVVYDLPAAAISSAATRTSADSVVVWARGPVSGGLSLLRQVGHGRRSVYAAGPGWRRDRLSVGVVHLRDLEAAVAALRGATSG